MDRLALPIALLLGCQPGPVAPSAPVDADNDGVPVPTDCDDADDTIFPGAAELCDLVDNDCDDEIDEGDAVDAPTWFLDEDGDGYGVDATAVVACLPPSEQHEPRGGDCDDEDDAFSPGATEDDCTDPNDYNCDGSVVFVDADLDGAAACEDCDDDDDDVSPSSPEICDGKDNDCDELIDLGDDSLTDALLLYPDNDDDGYGAQGLAPLPSCAPIPGLVDNDDDCNDARFVDNPSAPFDYDDDVDNDCDGDIDEDVGQETTTHDADIQDIWSSACGNCHTTGSSGGLNLADGYSATVGVASLDVPSMPLIEPGDPDHSYLWHKLQGTHTAVGGFGSTMPRGGALTAPQLLKIETWIWEGAAR